MIKQLTMADLKACEAMSILPFYIKLQPQFSSKTKGIKTDFHGKFCIWTFRRILNLKKDWKEVTPPFFFFFFG